MRVRKPTTHLVDIGSLDAVLWLPTISRKRIRMKTTCHRCGKQIEDEMFVCGFKRGERNMLFHRSCLDEVTEAMVQKEIAREVGDG